MLLYDLAYAYQITSKRVHSRKIYENDVISIFQDNGHTLGNTIPRLRY